MFFPIRFEGWAIYDVRRLIIPQTHLEESLYLEATHRIPRVFYVGSPWGESLTEGTIWINEQLHDKTFHMIRCRLRNDAEYLSELSNSMVSDLKRFDYEVQRCQSIELSNWNPRDLLEATAEVVGWFATNWLHPWSCIRMAVARILGNNRVDAAINTLLSSPEQPIFIKAHIALSTVSEENKENNFEDEWAPLYAISENKDYFWQQKKSIHPAQSQSSQQDSVKSLQKLREQRCRERNELIELLIRKERSYFGLAAANLLKEQLTFISCLIWQEEKRRLLQQRAYYWIQKWIDSATIIDLKQLSTQITWLGVSFYDMCKSHYSNKTELTNAD